METASQILTHNLSRLRRAKGYRSQEAFAAAADIPFPTYRDIEGGRSWPEKKTLEKIANALHIPEKELFRDPDQKPTLREAIDLIEQLVSEMEKVGSLPKGESPAPSAPAIDRNDPALNPFAQMISDNLPALNDHESAFVWNAVEQVLSFREPIAPGKKKKSAS